MASVRHPFSVNIADDPAAQANGEILPSHWNQEHTLSGVAEQTSLDALSHAVSVLSNTTSAALANLSDRIDLGGGTASVTSDELSAVSAQALSHLNVISVALLSEISNRTSADNALSVRVDTVSQAHSALSQAVSVLSNTNSAEHAALSVRINTVSQAHSALSQAVSVISTTLSNEASVRSAADAALSSRIDTVSNAVSATGNVANVSVRAFSAGGSATTSVKGLQSALNQISNTFSQAFSVGSVASARLVSLASDVSHIRSAVSNVSAQSAAGSATGLQAVINLLSNKISAVAGGSVTSNEASAISAQAASALSQALSVLSVTDAALSVRADSVANAVSVVSQALSVLSTRHTSLASDVSHIRSAVSNVSATSAGGGSATGLQAVVDALSNKISATAAGAMSITSAEFTSLQSDVSHIRSAVSNVSAQSAGGSATGLQAVINLLSNKISASGGGGGSVTSTEASAISQNASANAVSIVNAKLSTLSFTFSTVSVKGQQSVNNQLASVISDAMSAGDAVSADLTSVKSVIGAKAPWLAAKYVVISNLQSIAASALTDVSGMVLTVGADETWKFEGMVLVHTSGSNTAGLRLGFSTPPLSTPRFAVFDGVSAPAQSVGGLRAGAQMAVSGSNVILSVTSSQFAAAGSAVPFGFEGIFNVASAGTFRLQAANVASATQSPTHINGGYMIAYRLK